LSIPLSVHERIERSDSPNLRANCGTFSKSPFPRRRVLLFDFFTASGLCLVADIWFAPSLSFGNPCHQKKATPNCIVAFRCRLRVFRDRGPSFGIATTVAIRYRPPHVFKRSGRLQRTDRGSCPALICHRRVNPNNIRENRSANFLLPNFSPIRPASTSATLHTSLNMALRIWNVLCPLSERLQSSFQPSPKHRRFANGLSKRELAESAKMAKKWQLRLAYLSKTSVS
jgi:hypothetical protein